MHFRHIIVLLFITTATVVTFAQKPDQAGPDQTTPQSFLRLVDSDAADNGDHGDVFMSSPAPYTSTGVLLQAKPAWPDIIAKTGNNTVSSAFGVNDSSDSRLFTVRSDGNVGIGMTAPLTALHVYRATGAHILVGSAASDPMGGGQTGVGVNNGVERAFFGAQTGLGFVGTQSNTSFGVVTNNSTKLLVAASGNVGIGTSTPTTKLHVVGDANFTGTVTGGNIQAKYQDVAEWVPATTEMTSGTVVVLDTAYPNHVVASSRSYDTKVAGVISERPGLILGEAGHSKAMVATTGRVRMRVDATGVPIAIGDLLVTSDKPGMAMKSTPADIQGMAMHRPGTIVGKALEPLDGGEGEILVLLSLQ